MSKIFRSLIVCLVVLTTMGAGCSLTGGSKSVDNSKGGGVYKTTDSGATWAQTTVFPTSKGLGNIGTANIVTMAFDPQDYKTIYLGTTENGLLFTNNSGVTWQTPVDGQVQGGTVSTVAVDPKDMCTWYVGIGAQLFKTETCGRKFESVYDETRAKVIVRRVTVDWYDNSVVYSGLSNGDVLRSSDFGLSWTKVASTGKDISDLLVSNQDSRIILVGTSEGLWKSTDSGATWASKTEALKSFKNGNVISRIVQDSNGSTFVMATKYGLLRSSDVGDNWSALNLLTSANQVTIRSLAIDPTDSNKLYYATATTFYNSTDAGVTWNPQELSAGWAASYLLVDPQTPANIYMGRQMIEE